MISYKNLVRLLLITTIAFSTTHIIKAQCWNLVWADEFNGTNLDLGNWSYDIGASGWGNNELQYYTAGSNTAVSAGTLKITADDDGFGGAAYTSSRIVTKGNSEWTYGKFEARIKLPEGQGIWPAFWMLPTDNTYGIWPNSGEIDIMEFLGHQTSTIHGTAHWANSGGGHQFNGSNNNNFPSDYTSSFHTYTVEWDANSIQWYVDGVLYHNLTDSDISPSNWPFDQDFHFLLNVAVGGNWPGNPDGTTVFPQVMEVDWVRVYQQLSDISIEGETILTPNASGISYSVPDVNGTTYSWTVTNGTIVSGAGTHEIVVDWASSDGTVNLDLMNGCGIETLNTPVEIDANMILNPGFEEGSTNWFSDIFSSALATFYLNTSDSHSGSNSECVNVTNIGTAPWNIQLSPIAINLELGEEYIIQFYAKADINNRDMSIAIINASNFAYYGGTVYNLTDDWNLYSFTFTSPATVVGNINLQFGEELGTFCVDDFSIMKTIFLPIELGSFDGRIDDDQYAVLNWTTYSETNNYGFEVQSSLDGHEYETIGFVNGAGTSNQERAYSFTHRQHESKVYYRLKQIDYDEGHSISDVIILEKKKSDVVAFPTKMNNELNIVNIKYPSKISIYNSLGEVVFMQQHLQGEELSINVSHLKTGLYFLSIDDLTIKLFKN